jgi:rhomboid family GlyGly-CTERM serine protease
MGLDQAHKALRSRHFWLATAAVAVVGFLLELGGDSVRDALAYERAAIGAGQLWRLVSAHFVHLGWSHLVLNLAGLALVAWLVGHTFSWQRWLYVGLASIAAIGAGFWFLDPGLDWYVGLSGLLHGLLVAGLVAGIARRDREALILAAFVLAKLAWEQAAGPLPGSESTSGGAVIVDAHLYGAIGGVLGALSLWRSVRPAASI